MKVDRQAAHSPQISPLVPSSGLSATIPFVPRPTSSATSPSGGPYLASESPLLHQICARPNFARRSGVNTECRLTVLLSRSRISPVSKFRSSQRRHRISLRRHPVSTRRRIAAAAWTDARRSVGAARSTSPSRWSSTRVRNRSCFSTLKRATPRQGLLPAGRQPHASARENILVTPLVRSGLKRTGTDWSILTHWRPVG